MSKNRSTKQFVWGVSLFVALFVNFPIIFLNLPRLKCSTIAQLDVLIQIAVCFAYAILSAQAVYRNTKFPVSKSKRIIEGAILFGAFVVVLSLLNVVVVGLSPKIIPTVIARGFFVAVLSYFLSRFLVETERKNEVLLENEHLKHENLLVQLTSLKNQLNPHFLFNSLNTLSWLINEDKDKSQRYLQKLSQVLRYSLSMQEQSLVPLKEELALIESYIFLLQMRFGDNLKVVVDMPTTEFKIPPLSLQLLIENAIKHNVISKTSPLQIWIEQQVENQTLSVRNSLHIKANSEGTGIGLVNLNERFKILANREIVIQKDESFIVIIPLIA